MQHESVIDKQVPFGITMIFMRLIDISCLLGHYPAAKQSVDYRVCCFTLLFTRKASTKLLGQCFFRFSSPSQEVSHDRATSLPVSPCNLFPYALMLTRSRLGLLHVSFYTPV